MTEVDEVLLLKPYEALELASAAIFRRNGHGKFECVGSRGWQQMASLFVDSTDRACSHMAGASGAFHISGSFFLKGMPRGEAAPILALPILVRHHLKAFALYGGHTNGEDFDGDEIATLDRLGIAAGAGYICAALMPDSGD